MNNQRAARRPVRERTNIEEVAPEPRPREVLDGQGLPVRTKKVEAVQPMNRSRPRDSLGKQLNSPQALRRAMLVAEILGPPKALQKP